MFITKYFQVINLTVPSTWVSLLSAFFIAYLVVRLMFDKVTANFLADALFYFVIVWKLSVIITDFQTVLKFPLSLLYFNGGTTGVYLGIVAVGVYSFMNLRNKLTINTFGLVLGSVAIFSSYQILVTLLNEGPFIIRLVTVLSFSVFLLIVVGLKERFKEMPKELVYLLVGLHLFIGALQPAGILQTITIASVLIGAMLLVLIWKEKSFMEVVH